MKILMVNCMASLVGEAVCIVCSTLKDLKLRFTTKVIGMYDSLREHFI